MTPTVLTLTVFAVLVLATIISALIIRRARAANPALRNMRALRELAKREGIEAGDLGQAPVWEIVNRLKEGDRLAITKRRGDDTRGYRIVTLKEACTLHGCLALRVTTNGLQFYRVYAEDLLWVESVAPATFTNVARWGKLALAS